MEQLFDGVVDGFFGLRSDLDLRLNEGVEGVGQDDLAGNWLVLGVELADHFKALVKKLVTSFRGGKVFEDDSEGHLVRDGGVPVYSLF